MVPLKGTPGSQALVAWSSLQTYCLLSVTVGDLGTLSNNQAEGYNLLLACHLVMEKGYKSMQIFGDSKILIKALNSTDKLNNYALNIILQRTEILLKGLDKFDSFHILQDQNHLADDLAKKACLLPQGFLSINGEASYFHPIL